MGLISLVTTIDAGENVTGVTVAEVSGMIQWSYAPALTKTGVIWTRHLLVTCPHLVTFEPLKILSNFPTSMNLQGTVSTRLCTSCNGAFVTDNGLN